MGAKSKGSDESPSGRIGRKSKSASAIEGRYNLFAESTLSFGSESRGRELWKSKSDGSGEGKYRLHRGGTGSESTVSSLFPTAGQPIKNNEKGRSRSNKGGKKRKSTTRFMDVGEKSSTERSLNPGKGGRTERSASMAASRRTERSLNPGKGGRTERSAGTASKRPTNGSQERKGKGKKKVICFCHKLPRFSILCGFPTSTRAGTTHTFYKFLGLVSCMFLPAKIFWYLNCLVCSL